MKHRASVALIAVATTTVAALALQGQVSNQVHVVLILVACSAYVAMLTAARRADDLRIGLVSSVLGVELLAAAAIPPRATGDLWWYAIYGRIAAVYHQSPYIHVPAQFPGDSVVHFAGHGWAHVPSVYGPLFTAFSGVLGLVVGPSWLATRLSYQLLGVAAVAVCALLVWRRTRSPRAVAFLAAHPVIVLYIVNGGRNDILVGLACLGALLLARRDRPVLAGFVGALAILVKLTGVVGVVALVVATASRRNGHAARIAITAGVTAGFGYLLSGPRSITAPFGTAGARFSSGSIWHTATTVGSGLPSTHLVLLVMGLVVCAVVVRRRRAPASTVVVAAVTLVCLAAAYTTPGYVAWVLPVAALLDGTRLARIAAMEGVVLVALYEITRHPIAGPLGTELRAGTRIVVPFLMIVLIVALLRTTWTTASDTDSDSDSDTPVLEPV